MSKFSSVMDVDHVLTVCQRRCDDLGVSVRFDHMATTAYTNGVDIVLPIVKNPITKDGLDVMYGQVIHETGHHLRPTAFDILKAAQPPTHLMSLFNITEDDGMERERALAWKGDRIALSRMNALILEEVGTAWAAHFATSTEPQDPAPIASMVIGQLSRLEWDDESSIHVKKLLSILPTEVRELVDALDNEGWVGRFRGTNTPADAWNLAVDLAKRLYPNNPEQEYEQIREAGNKGATDPNATPRDNSADTMDVSKDVQGDGEETSTGSDDEDGEGQCISWKDVVVSEHNDWSKSEDGTGKLGITWEGRIPTGGNAIMPAYKVNVVDMAKNQVLSGGTYWHKFKATDEHNRAFANRIRRYIQAKARSVVQRDRLHGKLDRGSIVKLALPPIDGGEYNKKIFYTQRKHTMKDTAIFVLVDWSGSMAGKKMEYAADAAQRLVHTFDRVLNIPVALATFSNRKTTCDVGYIKKFNTRGTTEEAIAHRFSQFKNYSAGNDDADAINWAWHEIKKRKESRKILIVLSDGAPAGCFAGSPDECLSIVTRNIEHEGSVELYGVGIRSDAVSDYYTNWKFIKDPKEINDALFNLIKEGNNG